MTDFFEEDEPIEDVIRAFEQGEKGVTGPMRREATQAEMNIARAWVTRHRWTNPKDAEAEYERALSILVFGNCRPPLKNGRMPR